MAMKINFIAIAVNEKMKLLQGGLHAATGKH